MATDYEVFWYVKPKDLFREDNYMFFVPNDKMTADQKLNAILRFSIYFAVVMLFLRRSLACLLVPMITAVFTIVAYKANVAGNLKQKAVKDKSEVFDNEANQKCTRPTEENPFMNVLISDIKDNPTRPVACDVDDHLVKNKMEEYFEKNLYRDVDDIFHRDASDRQFYTMPVTTIPNDSGSFASWLYSDTGKVRDSYGRGESAPTFVP